MNVCCWPVGACGQDVLGPGSWCYYHAKIGAGLIVTTRHAWSPSELERIVLPAPIELEAARRRQRYYAGLTSGPGHPGRAQLEPVRLPSQ
jgi:hypothetical protein